MGSFGGCVLATGCEQGGAKNQAQEGYCRLPIADCRLPIADCRLPIADCRLPIADCRLPIADCRLPIADCRLPIADCRLPIADCRLPIADCRLPIADCRLPILRQRRLRSSCSGWFVSCLFLCVMPMASATDKSHYTQKTTNVKFFCNFFNRHSRPRLRGGRLRRESTAAGRRMLMAQSAI